MDDKLQVGRVTSHNLEKLVFAYDHPEEFIKTIPAQSLHLSIRRSGLSGAADLIEISSLEQIRVCLDLDLWQADSLNEENLWEWLALTDAQDDLIILQKVLKVIDLKIVSWLILKYVDVISLSESTDEPPIGDYRTPDKGNTWIKVNTSDSDRDFYLNRLLAMVFETSADLFYQLLSIPGVTTQTILEEEAYQDASKRVLAEGVPDREMAYSAHEKLSLEQAVKDINPNVKHPTIEDVQIIEPMIYDDVIVNPLSALFTSIRKRDELEAELSHLLNCALVYWKVDLSDYEQIMKVCTKVKGALNIGLELLLEKSTREAQEIYDSLGLQKIYQVGLSELRSIKQFVNFNPEQLEQISHQPELFIVIAGLKEPLPELAIAFNNNRVQSQDGSITPGYRAFEHHSEIKSVLEFIKKNNPFTEKNL